MFWNSVLKGFQVLLEWKIWLVIFVYSGVMHFIYRRFIQKLALNELFEKSDSDSYRQMDSFSILKMIVDSVLVVTAIFLILPILLGAHSFSSFTDLKFAWRTIVIIILITTGARIILAKIFGNSYNSFTKGGTQVTFFICVILISVIMNRVLDELPVSKKGVLPSFWLSIGYMLVSYFILLIFSFALGLITMPLSKESREFVTNSVITGMVLVMGIIYMRMYCYYTIEKVKGIDIKWDSI